METTEIPALKILEYWSNTPLNPQGVMGTWSENVSSVGKENADMGDSHILQT